jgi:tRNA(Ile)-lysidine synthetase-like protein
LAAQRDGDGTVELPGVEITRSFDQIRLTRAGSVLPAALYQVQLQVPGRTAIPGGSEICVIKLKKEEAARDWRYTNKGNDLDWVQVMQHGPLELRNWRPGDQYQPMGADRPIKVKLLFQKARVPSWERAAWPIITMGQQIVWVGGFGVAHGCAASASSEVLRVEHRAAESNL